MFCYSTGSEPGALYEDAEPSSEDLTTSPSLQPHMGQVTQLPRDPETRLQNSGIQRFAIFPYLYCDSTKHDLKQCRTYFLEFKEAPSSYDIISWQANVR